jgi:hypothetical protein
MSARLDSTIEFEQLLIKSGSFNRDVVEKSAAGVNGLLSIDLGSRGRKLILKGLLRAQSKATLKEKTEKLSLLADGKMHTLEAKDGGKYADLRVDSFEVIRQDHSGAGVCCEFEMKFTQLR